MKRPTKNRSTVRLTDRERILTHIICRLWAGNNNKSSTFGAAFTRGGIGSRKDELRPGDIVLGITATSIEPHNFSISEIVEMKREIGGALVRDLVTGETCNYSNEMLVAIDGLDRSDEVFLVGHQRIFYEKVQDAFQRGRSDEYRYGGIRFDGPSTARVSIRCKFGGHRPNEEAIPFEVSIRFNARMSVKAILAALRAGGLGTHEWQYRPRVNKP